MEAASSAFLLRSSSSTAVAATSADFDVVVVDDDDDVRVGADEAVLVLLLGVCKIGEGERLDDDVGAAA